MHPAIRLDYLMKNKLPVFVLASGSTFGSISVKVGRCVAYLYVLAWMLVDFSIGEVVYETSPRWLCSLCIKVCCMASKSTQRDFPSGASLHILEFNGHALSSFASSVLTQWRKTVLYS
jgi:hypothetical protein